MFDPSSYVQMTSPAVDTVGSGASYAYTGACAVGPTSYGYPPTSSYLTYEDSRQLQPPPMQQQPIDQYAYLPMKQPDNDILQPSTNIGNFAASSPTTSSPNELACYELWSPTGQPRNTDFDDVNLLEPTIGTYHPTAGGAPTTAQPACSVGQMPPPQQTFLLSQQHQPHHQQQLNQHHQQQLFQPPPYNTSPTGSSYTSSNGSDEGDDYYCWHPYKRSPSFPVVEPAMNLGSGAGIIGGGSAVVSDCRKRGKTTKKRKPKKDPNEPHKPVSAYALFFRDTQAAIKGQNPNASFGEVSKVVASMWDNLDPDAKTAYKQKTETAKKDYLKQLAAYRANQISKYGGNTSGLLDISHQSVSMYPADSTTVNLGAIGGTGTASNDYSSPRKASITDPSLAGKSLASLIAEPSPQRVLTATTTLTVPQAYIPTRSKVEYDDRQPQSQQRSFGDRAAGPGAGGAPSVWDREFRPSEGLLQHCRDVFNMWGPTRANGPPVTPTSVTSPPGGAGLAGYAPVG